MPSDSQKEALRSLPQVEEFLHHEAIEALTRMLPRDRVCDLARGIIAEARDAILAGDATPTDPDELATRVLRRALALERPSLRRVVNASGVVVHTNLGRSVLPASAASAATAAACGYSTLEHDCDKQARGSRHDHYEHLACAITGAEAALAVNNNAAAVMMVLAEFAAGRDAVISRGELVEIGGSFRVPDIMALSGARMVEVGTTNKTHLADYENALDDATALLLKVHPSNFRMSGFTESVSVALLRQLADKANAERASRLGADAGDVLVYEDLGSGALVDLTLDGYRETTVHDALAEGADIVSFSCDKLMGGPQAGLVVGKKRMIERLKQSPYARVLRLDKMAIAALEATLRLYMDEREARRRIPTLRMLTEDAAVVRKRTQDLADAIRETAPEQALDIRIEPDVSRAGGGALPMCDIPTFVARIAFSRGSAQDCERFFATQRAVPIVARLNGNCIVLDGRTLLEGDEQEIAQAFREYFEALEG